MSAQDKLEQLKLELAAHLQEPGHVAYFSRMIEAIEEELKPAPQPAEGDRPPHKQDPAPTPDEGDRPPH